MLTVDEYVFEINDDKFANEWLECLVHHPHKSAWHISEAERHDEPLEQFVSRLEGRLPLIVEADPDLVITTPEVNFGEDRRPM